MATHTRRSDETPCPVVLELLAESIDASLVLLPEYFTSSLGAIEDRVEIGRDNSFVVRKLAVYHPTLRPWDAGIGYEDVQAASKVSYTLIEYLFGVVVVCCIDLIRFACLESASILKTGRMRQHI